MKIILSPAKSLNAIPPRKLETSSIPHFISESEKLIKKLQKLNRKKLEDLMHISRDLAELNLERYKGWQRPEKINETIFQAGLMFNGEVYKGLDFENMPEKSIDYAQENVRILSGLYGILKPLDLIYPYRLEMGTKLAISPKIPNLYAFWDQKITKFLQAEMQADESVLNLASVEYFKVLKSKNIKRRVISPVFKDFKNGDHKIIMVFAKHARGAMANYCCKNKITDIDTLKSYNVDGYSYDDRLSTENEWVFLR